MLCVCVSLFVVRDALVRSTSGRSLRSVARVRPIASLEDRARKSTRHAAELLSSGTLHFGLQLRAAFGSRRASCQRHPFRHSMSAASRRRPKRTRAEPGDRDAVCRRSAARRRRFAVGRLPFRAAACSTSTDSSWTKAVYSSLKKARVPRAAQVDDHSLDGVDAREAPSGRGARAGARAPDARLGTPRPAHCSRFARARAPRRRRPPRFGRWGAGSAQCATRRDGAHHAVHLLRKDDTTLVPKRRATAGLLRARRRAVRIGTRHGLRVEAMSSMSSERSASTFRATKSAAA